MDNKLSDNDKLKALEQAQFYFNHHHNMSRQDRRDGVVALAEWGLFSIAQLAQLSNYSTATLYGWGLTGPGASGRFNPRSLDAMRLLLLDRMNGKRPSNMLLKILVDDGNSQRTIHKFTGIQASTVSRMMKRINGSAKGRHL